MSDVPTLDAYWRQQRYADRYFEIHGHREGEPHTEACTPREVIDRYGPADLND